MQGDILVLLMLNWLCYVYADRAIDVLPHTCDDDTEIHLDSVGTLHLEWRGDNLPEVCKYQITKENLHDDEICVDADVYNVSNPDAKIQYHEYAYTTRLAKRKYDYISSPTGEWCTYAPILYISFESTGGSDHVKLRLFVKKYENPGIYAVVIVAVVITVIFVIIVVVVIVIKRRQAANMHGRTRYGYQTTSPEAVTMQTGPNPQAVYQPQAVAPGQMGYTYHPPQAAYPVGTNQPTGYPTQQAGYVPPPGGYYGQGPNQTPVYPTGNVSYQPSYEQQPLVGNPAQGIPPQPSPLPPGPMHKSIPTAPPDPCTSQPSSTDPPPYPGY